ncbi:hypothetical protein Tco_0047597, partial [Tanacetum coccineum]
EGLQRATFTTPPQTVPGTNTTEPPPPPLRNKGPELGADNLTLEGVATELAPSDFVSQNYETLVALMQEETKKRSSQSLQARLNFGPEDKVSPPRHQKERRGKDNRRPPVFGRIGKKICLPKRCDRRRGTNGPEMEANPYIGQVVTDTTPDEEHVSPTCPNRVAIESQGVPKKITKLLDHYLDVFSIPITLPPKRLLDHKIPLKEGIVPINSRPYRHPPTQKDAIEVMKDGTWRMYIDYRKMNDATIKDKFPNPVIEELIDELQGS